VTQHSRVIVSIFIISLIILPIFFILAILLPMMLYNAVELYFQEYKDFFNILGIVFLICLLIPPWDSEKRAIVANAFHRFTRNFLHPEHSEEIVFTDDIIHFAQLKEDFNPSENCFHLSFHISKFLHFLVSSPLVHHQQVKEPSNKIRNFSSNSSPRNSSSPSSSKNNGIGLHSLSRAFISPLLTFFSLFFKTFFIGLYYVGGVLKKFQKEYKNSIKLLILSKGSELNG